MKWCAWRSVSAAVAVLGLGGASSAQELYLTYRDDEGSLLGRIDGPTGQLLEEMPILGAPGLGWGLAVRNSFNAGC